MERTQDSVRKTHAVLLIHMRGIVSSHRPYLELSHSLPAPQRPLKPSARLLLQSRAASGRWRHLRPSLATDRKTKCLSCYSSTAAERAPHPRRTAQSFSSIQNPLFPSGTSQESDGKICRAVDKLSPCRQSTRAMKSR